MANIETLLADTRYYAEVAAPATPAAGSGVTYVKTDGKFYFKNDAGTETDLTLGGAGAGVGAYDIERYTGGAITVSSTTAGADIGASPADLVVAAAAGDLLLVGISVREAGTATANSLRFDVATIVAAAPVNYFSSATGTPASTGISGWFMHASAASSVGPPVPYVVQAGDISAGTVTLSLRAWVSASNRDIEADAAGPLVFWVKNLLQ